MATRLLSITSPERITGGDIPTLEARNTRFDHVRMAQKKLKLDKKNKHETQKRRKEKLESHFGGGD